MKKSLLTAVLAAASWQLAVAQTITMLPTSTDPYLMSTCISENGKYVGGADAFGTPFVADWATGTVVFGDGDDEDSGGHIRAVSNGGVGVGVCGPGITLSIDGTVERYGDSDDAILSGITPDGSLIVGERSASSMPVPCYWQGGECVDLPQVTDEWATIKCLGTAAKYVSGDGSVIAGHFVDKLNTRPLVVWHRNRDGKTYSIDPVFKRFCFKRAGYIAIMSPSAMSNNGKWIAVTASSGGNVWLGRYNVELDSLEIIDYPGLGEGDICESSGISDDGTVLGVVTSEMEGRVGLICPAGKSEAVKIADYFPDLDDLALFDANGANVPFAITPDGRYITGYGVSLKGDSQLYVTYVIDTEGTGTGVGNIASATAEAPAEAYTVDGLRRDAKSFHGLGIMKWADGKTAKVVKR